MLNYLNNNLVLINELEELYKNGINISFIINRFKNGELIKHAPIDYSRFRVFVDSCMLLNNKNNLNKYTKNKFSFREYLDNAKIDKYLQFYTKNIENFPLISNINDLYLFYSLDGKNKNPWDQIATIRNAMAHMQYGGFSSTEDNNFLLYYFLYNKDNGVRKDYGIVFESILHQFIQCFFSNYSYGLLYKYSFFSYDDLSKQDKKHTLNKLVFNEITYNDNYNEIYNGYNTNLLSELVKTLDYNKRNQLIEENKNMLLIKKYNWDKVINKKRFKKFVKKYKLKNFNECVYGLKAFLDFESEFSNFLVHIVQLNEVLYEFSLLNDTDRLNSQAIFEGKLMELVKDNDKKISFEIGFTILKAMNFSLRTEDDDYTKLDYEKVDVSMFDYEEIALQNYTKVNNIEENMRQKYIIKRMRNALMHGNISLNLTSKGEVVFIFSDIYNKRKENISISLHNLKVFLSQESLYKDIPKDTMLLIFSKK